MGFIDSYKHLEKLCGEILNDDRRLSAYIDEMTNTYRGSFYVRNWDNDLKTLKHYRWIRNQISHEPDCNESNMCSYEDEMWLNEFYLRIMNQTDPLSEYRQAVQHAASKNTRNLQNDSVQKELEYINNNQKRNYFGLVAVGIILFIFIIVFYLLNKA